MSANIDADRGENRRDSHAPSLQQAAAALWGEGFWGRDQPNPETDQRRVKDQQR